MRKSTKAISLVLMGTAASLLGYEAITPSHSRPAMSTGSDFDNPPVEYDGPEGPDPSTRPSGRSSSYRSIGVPYHSSSYSSGSSSFSSGSSGSSSFHSTSSSSHSPTSHGGFGSTGHSAAS